MNISRKNMTMLKIQSTRKNEKGIALLFTLIMLSLLLMLAMSFALDSMFSQKAAYNSASSSSASFSGHAQMKGVISLLRYGNPVFTNSSVYSGGGSTGEYNTSDHDRDMLLQDSASTPEYNSLLLTEGIITTDNIESLCFNSSLAVDDRLSWTYQRNADGNIIGRTAFVIIPTEKIPFNSLVKSTVDESAGQTVGVYNEKRIGAEVSEINVRNAYVDSAGYAITPGITDKLNYTGTGNGTFDGSWSSYSDVYSTIDISDSKFKTNFENSFSIDSVKEEEAFWVDINGDNLKESGELFKRFDLTRDWNTANNSADKIFIKENILLDSDEDGIPDLDMEAWTNSDSDSSSKGLPWLACFGYNSSTADETLRGTFSSVKNRRYQIAANLKDYCDNDGAGTHRPTSDTNPNSWEDDPAPTPPNYTGNEKTPYIDKVGLCVEVSHYEVGSDPYDVSALVTIYPCVGLVNMYDTDWPYALTVTMDFSVTIETTVAGASAPTTVSETKSFSSVTLPVASGDWPGNGYSKFMISSGLSSFLTGTKTGITGTRNVDFRITNINFSRVALSFVSAGYDYVKDLSHSPTLSAVALGPGTTEYFCYGFAAHDPRQNLNGTTAAPDGSKDWLALTSVNAADLTALFSISYVSAFPAGYYKCWPNSQNSSHGTGGDNTDAPSVGDGINTDMETGVADPANGSISTARIKNGAMESPWELGFIHRGAKWETLNLKKYDTSKAYGLTVIPASGGKNYILGGGAYNLGDANILDQIKMVAAAKSLEKVNIASQKADILKALFSQIETGCPVDSTVSISSMVTGGTLLTMSDANRQTIMDMFTTTSATDNLTRACVADNLKTFAGGTTDAAQEELIGKVINLVKIAEQGGSGNYTIVIVSQAIKDVGGDGTDISITKTSADGLATQTVACQLGRFDMVGPTGTPTLNDNWKKNVYGDEITGVQKIVVKIYKGIDNSITITSLKYSD